MNTCIRNGTYYLNNTGHRWVNYTDGIKDKITLLDTEGNPHTRTVIYWEAFGNFAVAIISYKGKRIRVFADEVLQG